MPAGIYKKIWGNIVPTVEERFWSKVNKTDSCWVWTASKDRKGYGYFRSGNKEVRAHRFSYELHKGKIPKELVIDHLCYNTSCVNPSHLEAVTSRENTVIRGKNNVAAISYRKTHCDNGHEFNGTNTYKLNGSRYCRPCNKIASRKYRNRMKLKRNL